MFALCAANEPWIVVLSFLTPAHPVEYRVSVGHDSYRFRFSRSLSLSLAQNSRLNSLLLPRPLRRSTLVAQNSTLTFAPTFPSESFVRDWKIRIFESNTWNAPLNSRGSAENFLFLFLPIDPFSFFIFPSLKSYRLIWFSFSFFCKSSWRRIRFFLIFCIIVFLNFGILSCLSKRRDGKNVWIIKVSIGRNFCAMAIQMDCHFQMFRTRYGKREREIEWRKMNAERCMEFLKKITCNKRGTILGRHHFKGEINA